MSGGNFGCHSWRMLRVSREERLGVLRNTCKAQESPHEKKPSSRGAKGEKLCFRLKNNVISGAFCPMRRRIGKSGRNYQSRPRDSSQSLVICSQFLPPNRNVLYHLPVTTVIHSSEILRAHSAVRALPLKLFPATYVGRLVVTGQLSNYLLYPIQILFLFCHVKK